MGEAGLYHAVPLGTPDGGLPQAIRRLSECYNRARMTLQERVQAYIDQHHLLKPGQHLLVGVSGGADSLCLLDLLLHLGYRPLVAHFDHALRPESAGEAQFVADLTVRLGCPVVVERVDQGVFTADKAGSLEAVARQARYRFFAKVAVEHHLDTIATGHTADDQAETVLLHLLRGSGLNGLRGMLPATDMSSWQLLQSPAELRLVRPLLAETHMAAGDYCEEHGLKVQDDSSNRDLEFTRNRIRHELLPLLETYNPRISQALNRLADITREDVELIDRLVREVRPEIMHKDQDAQEALSVACFAQQPTAIQRGLLRQLLVDLAGQEDDFGLENVERLRNYILDFSRPNALQLSGSLRVLNQGTSILFERSVDLNFSSLYPQTTD